jgi:hypothetical protein
MRRKVNVCDRPEIENFREPLAAVANDSVPILAWQSEQSV